MEGQSQEWRRRAEARIRELTMPPGALGRLLEVAVDLAGMTRTLEVPCARKCVVLMAGDHGIVREGVCPQPSVVTQQMVRNFAAGGAAINVLAGVAGARLELVDMGVAGDLGDLYASGRVRDCRIGAGTADFAAGPAMSRAQAEQAVAVGRAVAEELAASTDLFGVGEMGIGNSSPAAAIVTVLSGEADPAPYVGPGAGLAPERLAHKAAVIRRGIALNRPDPHDALDVLAKVGGFEIGGIAGVILGAAARHRPVVVDGFIATAGALIAAALEPAARDYMILAHGSAEPGHRKMAELLGKRPLLDLGMRLGEGTGAALAMPIVESAAAILAQMATFDGARVTAEGLR